MLCVVFVVMYMCYGWMLVFDGVWFVVLRIVLSVLCGMGVGRNVWIVWCDLSVVLMVLMEWIVLVLMCGEVVGMDIGNFLGEVFGVVWE